jgi:hypothetical protein
VGCFRFLHCAFWHYGRRQFRFRGLVSIVHLFAQPFDQAYNSNRRAKNGRRDLAIVEASKRQVKTLTIRQDGLDEAQVAT